MFDHNGDGYISKLELHKTMNELGIELTREDLDAMMDEADVNKDGRIDYAGQSHHHSALPAYMSGRMSVVSSLVNDRLVDLSPCGFTTQRIYRHAALGGKSAWR